MERHVISNLRGRLVSKHPSCVISVGGVGFELKIPEKDRASLPSLSSEVAFSTYLYVREDRLTLYGFLDEEDRDLFKLLLDVSGIGPKLALGMLASHSADRVVRAVQTGD